MAALLLAGLCVSARAATYYVSPTGSDANAGTSAAPLLTLQAGVNKAAAGDTITVMDGTYGPTGGAGSMGVDIAKSGGAGAWITLQAQHPGAAILDCQLVCHSYINFGAGSGYWIIKGFDIRNGYWGGIFSNSMSANNVQVLGNVIHHIGNRSDSSDIGIMGIYTDAGASGWLIEGNVFHDIGRTSVLTGTHDHGIYTHGTAMTIRNNVFYGLKNGWHIQTAAGFSGTIANNTFYGPDPVSGTVGQVMLWDQNSNLTIRNNIFYGSSAVGLTTYALSVSGTCSIDHNLAYTPGATVTVIGGAPPGCTETAEKVNADPKPANPAAYDFHLTAGSPAIDAGATVAGETTDFAGTARPQGGAFDIGAYEYAAAAPAPPPTTVPAGCTMAVLPNWYNVTLTGQTGVFTLQFDATPALSPMDGLVGACNGAATAYASLAAIVRFNNAGRIDARNGAAYAAATAIPYSAGRPYHFRLLINVPARVYSAYVTPSGGAEQTIGANYAFRVEQAAVSALGNLGLQASSGSLTVCNQTVTAAAPLITAVSASNATAAGCTVSWLTNVAADSTVDYGATTSYGATTPTNAAMTTSHSVPVAGLSAATTYHYRVKSKDASGNLAVSSDATFATAAAPAPPPAPAASCVSVPMNVWKNEPFTPLTGTFTLTFAATPGSAAIDGTFGLSNVVASAFSQLAVIVRFNSSGKIDARNGSAYAAAASIPYSAGVAYRFRLVVNAAAHTYSAYVTAGAGSEQLLASNYAFRTESATLSRLSNFAAFSDQGTAQLCSVVSGGAIVPLK